MTPCSPACCALAPILDVVDAHAPDHRRRGRAGRVLDRDRPARLLAGPRVHRGAGHPDVLVVPRVVARARSPRALPLRGAARRSTSPIRCHRSARTRGGSACWSGRTRERAGRRSAISCSSCPLGVFTLVLTFSAWCGSLALFLLPIVRVQPSRRHRQVLPLRGRRRHRRPPSRSSARSALLVIAPWLTVLLGRLDVVVASLVPRSRPARGAEERRVRLAEAGRVAAVTSAEAERRRIERDLHDGAQQRLVTLAMDLGDGTRALRHRSRRRPRSSSCAPTTEPRPRSRSSATSCGESIRSSSRTAGLDAALSALVARAPIPVVPRGRRRSCALATSSRAPRTSSCPRR